MNMQAKNSKVPVHKKYKDRLFCHLFSEKAHALSLYNAINETNYTDVENLEIVTLEDVLYLSMKNDLALCFHDCLDLFEQQSTVNLNMPVRGFLYFARELEGWLSRYSVNIYQRKQVEIPAPGYYVLYNGSTNLPEKQTLLLSDAFKKKVTGYEWTAHVLNINVGKNDDLMEHCPTLKEYSQFIESIKKHRKDGLTMEEAINQSIDSCIEEGILEEYLRKHKAEVKGMVLTEFDQKLYEETLYAEGREDGRREGIQKGKEEGRFISMEQLISNAHLSQEEAMKLLNFSLEEQEAYKQWKIDS
ncbi:MAG: hypothetical protein Q4D90_11525 [bacterium]|nr:hypothetical protein [bacterium]